MPQHSTFQKPWVTGEAFTANAFSSANENWPWRGRRQRWRRKVVTLKLCGKGKWPRSGLPRRKLTKVVARSSRRCRDIINLLLWSRKKMKLLTFRYFQNFLSVFQDIWFWKQAISVVLFGPLFRSQILLKHDILLNFVILGVFNHLNFGLLTSKINPDTLNIIEYT